MRSKICVLCREKILVDRSLVRRPDWAQCDEWNGWNWIPRNQSLINFTPARAIEITVDGEVVLDMYSDYWGSCATIEALTPDAALKIANIIAENDGGWSRWTDEETAG